MKLVKLSTAGQASDAVPNGFGLGVGSPIHWQRGSIGSVNLKIVQLTKDSRRSVRLLCADEARVGATSIMPVGEKGRNLVDNWLPDVWRAGCGHFV